MQPIPKKSAKGSIATKMKNLTRTYGYFFVAEPTASAAEGNQVDEAWSIQIGENFKSVLDGIFRCTAAISKFEAELANRCQPPVKTSGDYSSACFLKYSESSQKGYKAFSDSPAWVLISYSLSKKRYHGTATWRSDLVSYKESISNPILSAFTFPSPAIGAQLKIKENDKNTTSWLMYGGSEHEDLYEEKTALLKTGNCDEQHKNISEGTSLRIVWVKTDHPEGVGVTYSNQVIYYKKANYHLRF